MNVRLLTVAGLALAVSAPALALVEPTPNPVQVPASFTDLDARLSNAWAELNNKWLSGAITDREFAAATDALVAVTEASKAVYPEAATARYRIAAAIEDLKTRATRVARQAQYAQTVWEQIVDFRLTRALRQAQQRIVAGNLPAEEARALFAQITRELTSRAESAVGDTQAQTVRQRLQSMIDTLVQKAGNYTPTDLTPFQEALAEDVVYRRFQWVATRTTDKTATNADFTALSDAVNDRSAILATKSDVAAAYQAAIDRAMTAYKNGAMTERELEALKAALVLRARADTR